MDRSTLGVFLAGDLLAAGVALALVLAGQTAAGIAAGVVIVLVTTAVGAGRLRR